MHVKFIVVGKTSFPYLKEGTDLYLKRLVHYAKMDYIEIPVKIPKSAKERDVKLLESKAFLKHLSSSDTIILLDERGKKFTSISFSKWLEKFMLNSTKSLVFLVGGPYGFSDEIIKLSSQKISLSEMTFSHQMIRLFFVEQLYRGFTILKGEPYHHE